MFGASRRAPPKPAGSPAAAQAKSNTLIKPAIVQPRFTTRPPVSSPLSSVPSTSSPPSPAKSLRTIVTTTILKKTVVSAQKAAPAKRTYNAAKLPEKRAEAVSAGNDKGKQRAAESDSDDGSSSGDDWPARKKARPSSKTSKSSKSASRRSVPSKVKSKAYSSELDPLTPSEAEDGESDLSSVDEDYFAHIATKVDGAAVTPRDVAAVGKGAMDGKSSESLVLENRRAYVHYFSDPSNPQRLPIDWAGSEIPAVELEYPAAGAKERFALLAPRTDDEYNPIEDVLRTVLTTLDHFLTPEQSHLYFGHLPGKTSFSAFLYNKSSSNSRSGTPAAGTPSGSTPNPARPSSDSPLPSASTPSVSTPQEAAASFFAIAAACAAPAPVPTPPSESLIRTLERARSKRDGPSFLAAIRNFNIVFLGLKQAGIVEKNIKEMKGLKEKVWQKVFYQCYDRSVGPEVEELRRYEAFSDNVYGELLPGFMNEIFEKTHLGPGKVFVDLGSGVGNCVVQAALATGATSYGFENMAAASRLARRQVDEAEKRFRMWGLNGGEMKVVEADFCQNPEVGPVMQKADVVLVNNEVFSSALNDRLSYLFLDLPPSAKILSLKPFLPQKFKITSHNAHSPFAILAQSASQRYKPGSVSWKMEGGTYFLSRVDRTRVERFEKKEREREERRLGKIRERKEKREGSASSGTSGSKPRSRAASKGIAG
ncbi:hypothetical protein JCM11641_001433 [Rhodosporidiobolus odoratus]